MVSFLNPHLLWFLLFIPIAFYLYLLANKRKKKAAMKFSQVGILKVAVKKQFRRSQWLFILTVLSLALLILGLADPHLPLEQTKEGVNVVLSLDISGSMQAKDYEPTRLEAAKRSAKILLESLEPKDNAGIVIFESGATTAAYLSPFKDKVIEKLESISPKEGRTALGDGLSLAIDMATSIPNKKKVVILLSDGVNNAGVVSPAEAVQFAKQNKIQVHTIGMGSDEKAVLGYDLFGRPQYAELDEQTLKDIAAATGGEYYKSVDTNTLNSIYEGLSEKIEREKEETSVKNYVIALAILIILVELYLRYGGARVIQ